MEHEEFRPARVVFYDEANRERMVLDVDDDTGQATIGLYTPSHRVAIELHSGNVDAETRHAGLTLQNDGDCLGALTIVEHVSEHSASTHLDLSAIDDAAECGGAIRLAALGGAAELTVASGEGEDAPLVSLHAQHDECDPPSSQVVLRAGESAETAAFVERPATGLDELILDTLRQTPIGLTAAQIGSSLDIAVHRVERHLVNLDDIGKVRCHDKTVSVAGRILRIWRAAI